MIMIDDRLPLDRDLRDLPKDLRWREWMNRIEAVIFAGSKPVGRDQLQKVVGQGADIDLLIEDIQAEVRGRAYELIAVAGGWMYRTRSQYAEAIKIAAGLVDQALPFDEMEMAVLAAIACHQPVSRAGLADIFGKEVNRDSLDRLRFRELIANGPKSPQQGAPHTFVTTPQFLATFDMQDLRDLPDFGDEDVLEATQ